MTEGRTRLRSFAIITTLLVLFGAAPAIAQSNYRFVQIGTGQTPAYDINDEGVAVGFFVFGDPNGNRGYRWTESTGPIGLAPTPGDVNKFPFFGSAQVLAINNGGTVVGQGAATGGVPFVPTILSPGGTFTFLPPSETPSVLATARGVSNTGAVVGKWRANDQAAFYWTAATGIEAISPTPSDAFFARDAYDVNDAGMVVGYCSGTECGIDASGYLWSRTGGHLVLPKVAGFSGTFHEALAINERNQVVGRYGGGGVGGVFLWSAATGTVDLAAPAGLPQFVDINDRGQIVATIAPHAGGGTTAYLFNNGVWTDLNTLLPAGVTFHIDTARAINNHGWIAGSGAGSLSVGYVLIAPTVDVTVNGEDGPLTLGPASPLQMSLAFDGGNGNLLNPAEVYIGFASPFGVFWFTPGGLSATPTRLYAGPLPTFGPVPLLNLPSAGVLPAGTYVWFTIVDHDTDGALDGHFFDFVVTTRTP